MNNVLIRELNFPIEIEGATVPDANGDYNIFINANLSPEKKKETLEHELRHIQCNHHHRCTSVAEDEAEANQAIQPIIISDEVYSNII